MKTKLILVMAVLILPLLSSAQGTKRDSTNVPGKILVDSTLVAEWKPSCSMFFELFGKGWYSLNLDYRRTISHSFSFGVEAVEDAVMPSAMYYHFGGKRFRFELGGGASMVFTGTDGLNGMMVHGVVGYRYQKMKGLLFRIGFTPFLGIPFTDEGRTMLVPLIGVSLGYSF